MPNSENVKIFGCGRLVGQNDYNFRSYMTPKSLLIVDLLRLWLCFIN